MYINKCLCKIQEQKEVPVWCTGPFRALVLSIDSSLLDHLCAVILTGWNGKIYYFINDVHLHFYKCHIQILVMPKKLNKNNFRNVAMKSVIHACLVGLEWI
jgi:hypothetical protein